MATAAFIAPLVSQGLLVDVGSTTTDIIPIRQKVLALGYDDYQRMVYEELVYTGVVRTSIMAVARRIPFGVLVAHLGLPRGGTRVDGCEAEQEVEAVTLRVTSPAHHAEA